MAGTTRTKKTEKKVGLADLTPAARKALVEEAKAEQAGDVAHDAAEAEAALAERDTRIRELMDARDHLRACPIGDGEGDVGRVELYAQRKPPKADPGTGIVVEPAREVTAVHCLECGGTAVIDRPYRAVLDDLEREEVEA